MGRPSPSQRDNSNFLEGDTGTVGFEEAGEPAGIENPMTEDVGRELRVAGPEDGDVRDEAGITTGPNPNSTTVGTTTIRPRGIVNSGNEFGIAGVGVLPSVPEVVCWAEYFLEVQLQDLVQVRW